MRRTGVEAFLELLAGFGVRYIFGNPGTTELPLNDALAGDSRFQYMLGLQEVPVMSMADGYAMASGGVGVVNLHISCGLGNAMGMLYNAFREGSPLLVTAGQQDRRLAFEEPLLGGDMVSVTRPWTKWSVEVARVEDLPVAVRRAVQLALTPPTGPVFMSLPIDVQMEASGALDMTPIRLPDARVQPPAESIRRAAAVLLEANRPGILAGSRVTQMDAVGPLTRIADSLGAAVFSEPKSSHGRLPFPCDHPLYAGQLPLWSPDVRERLDEFDVLLVAGMDLLRQYIHYEPSRAIPEHIRLVHLDEDAWQLGKNYPVEVGVIGHTRVALEQLATVLDSTIRQNADYSAAADARTRQWSDQHAESRERLIAKIDAQREKRPMTPLTLMSTVADVLPPNVAVVEEAVTTTGGVLERLGALKNTDGYFAQRGWALGWGLGCAIGVRLAWPDRPVLAMLGDGAAMYGIQGLWTAARYRIPVTFVICNNAQYQIMKMGAKGLRLAQAKADKFTGFDLVDPELDFVALARGLGVQAHRVSEPVELSDRLRGALAGDQPILFDVPISRQTPDEL